MITDAKTLEMAKRMIKAKGGLWDALENECPDLTKCQWPPEMHKEYWLKKAAELN
jgi:hypothetical protein